MEQNLPETLLIFKVSLLLTYVVVVQFNFNSVLFVYHQSTTAVQNKNNIGEKSKQSDNIKQAWGDSAKGKTPF